MNYKKIVGEFGEKLATEYLIRKGYEIIKRNAKISYQEIDIIAKDSDKIVFIEVKTRTSDAYGYGEEAIGRNKIKNIKRAIMNYVCKNNYYLDKARFDVLIVNIDKENKIAKIKHYINLF